jgi:hypothetical protein
MTIHAATIFARKPQPIRNAVNSSHFVLLPGSTAVIARVKA